MGREGASVVVADINGAEAERVAGELRSAVAAEVDVSDEPSVVRMVETAVESFGGLDVLHNNATDSSTNAVDTDIVTLDMAVFDRLVAVNLKGQVMGCKHAIPHMLARGGGSIVNTASVDASSTRPCVPPTEPPGRRRSVNEIRGVAVREARPSTSKRHSRCIQCRDSARRGRRQRRALPCVGRKPPTSNAATLMVDGGATVYMASTKLAGGGKKRNVTLKTRRTPASAFMEPVSARQRPRAAREHGGNTTRARASTRRHSLPADPFGCGFRARGDAGLPVIPSPDFDGQLPAGFAGDSHDSERPCGANRETVREHRVCRGSPRPPRRRRLHVIPARRI